MAVHWRETQILALVDVWSAEIARAKASGRPHRVRGHIEAIGRAFLESMGISEEKCPLAAVSAEIGSLKYFFERICELDEAHRAQGKPSWFELPPTQRSQIRQRLQWRHERNDVTQEVFARMSRRFAELPLTLSAPRKPTRKANGATVAAAGDIKSSKVRHWGHTELMALARAIADTRSVYRGRKCNAEQDALLSLYRCYGGLLERSWPAVQRQIRSMKFAYDFIVGFDAQARAKRTQKWHNRPNRARNALAATYNENKRVLLLMDAKMFAILDQTPEFRVTRAAPRTPRSERPPQRTRSRARSMGARDQSIDARLAMEQRHRSMSTRRAPVSTNKSWGDRENLFEDIDSDMSTLSGSGYSVDESPEKSPCQGIDPTRRHGRKRDSEDGEDEPAAPSAKRRKDEASDDELLLMEIDLTTVMAENAKVDQALTAERIQENQHMLLGIHDAYKQANGFDSVSAVIAREMAELPGRDLLEIQQLMARQRERRNHLMHGLLSSLADNHSNSS